MVFSLARVAPISDCLVFKSNDLSIWRSKKALWIFWHTIFFFLSPALNSEHGMECRLLFPLLCNFLCFFFCYHFRWFYFSFFFIFVHAFYEMGSYNSSTTLNCMMCVCFLSVFCFLYSIRYSFCHIIPFTPALYSTIVPSTSSHTHTHTCIFVPIPLRKICKTYKHIKYNLRK